MKLLLDTHIFLWWINDDSQLEESVKQIIADPENEVYLSVASIWEVLVKFKLGKIAFSEPPDVFLPEQREKHQILSLPLGEASVCLLASLPDHSTG
jgi:PIN domain nuclease of toxin-antitoxin system